MTIIETIILGIVQGLTEFLPISSSGHLVVFQNLLGFHEPELLLDSSLHLGTLFAVCIYFRSDLKNMATEIWHFQFKKSHADLFLWVLVGSVPTGLMGLMFRDTLEGAFGSLTVVGIMLLATGFIVAATRLIPPTHTSKIRVGLFAALAVGVAQGLAIMPGISRSGATIVCALLCGLSRDLAGRYSFLLSIPAIVGALMIQMNTEALGRVGMWPLFMGFAFSAFTGSLALKLLMGMIRKGHLYYFAPYCWAVGMLILLLSS